MKQLLEASQKKNLVLLPEEFLDESIEKPLGVSQEGFLKDSRQTYPVSVEKSRNELLWLFLEKNPGVIST